MRKSRQRKPNDLSRCLAALDVDHTLIVVVGLACRRHPTGCRAPASKKSAGGTAIGSSGQLCFSRPIVGCPTAATRAQAKGSTSSETHSDPIAATRSLTAPERQTPGKRSPRWDTPVVRQKQRMQS